MKLRVTLPPAFVVQEIVLLLSGKPKISLETAENIIKQSPHFRFLEYAGVEIKSFHGIPLNITIQTQNLKDQSYLLDLTELSDANINMIAKSIERLSDKIDNETIERYIRNIENKRPSLADSISPKMTFSKKIMMHTYRESDNHDHGDYQIVAKSHDINAAGQTKIPHIEQRRGLLLLVAPHIPRAGIVHRDPENSKYPDYHLGLPTHLSTMDDEAKSNTTAASNLKPAKK